MIWGNPGGQEIGMGRERGGNGEGGGQFTSNLGPGWTGFQVSKRDSRKGWN